jgi:hypothetical protein
MDSGEEAPGETKSEIRIPKSETNSEKKSQIGKIQNSESERSLFGTLRILVI